MQEQQLDNYRMALQSRYLDIVMTILLFVFVIVACMRADKGEWFGIVGVSIFVWVLFGACPRCLTGGKYLWYYLDSAGKLVWTVSSGKAEGIDFFQVCSEQMFRIPLGGCFRGSAVIQSISFPLKNFPWRICRIGWFPKDPSWLQVRLTDRNGNQVTLRADEALQIIGQAQSWGVVPRLWFNDRYHLRRNEPLARNLFEVLKEAVSRIDATKQFIKSKQAQDIREWLVQRLQELDPNWFPKVRPKS